MTVLSPSNVSCAEKRTSIDTNSEILFQLRPRWKAAPKSIVWQIVKLVFKVRLNKICQNNNMSTEVYNVAQNKHSCSIIIIIIVVVVMMIIIFDPR